VSNERATGVERSVAGGLAPVLLAVAATAGALVGFGVRERAPARLFAAAGQQLRGVPVFVTPDRGFGLSAWLGVAQHLVVVTLWAVLFISLAARLRGLALAGAAAAFAAGLFVVDAVLPGVLRLAAGALTPGQRLAVAIALAAGLALGMRLAPHALQRVSSPER
jgi:hypothetical protein